MYVCWYVEGPNDARTTLMACFSILLITHLSFLEQLIHDLISLFRIAVVTSRSCSELSQTLNQQTPTARRQLWEMLLESGGR